MTSPMDDPGWARSEDHGDNFVPVGSGGDQTQARPARPGGERPVPADPADPADPDDLGPTVVRDGPPRWAMAIAAVALAAAGGWVAYFAVGGVWLAAGAISAATLATTGFGAARHRKAARRDPLGLGGRRGRRGGLRMPKMTGRMGGVRSRMPKAMGGRKPPAGTSRRTAGPRAGGLGRRASGSGLGKKAAAARSGAIPGRRGAHAARFNPLSRTGSALHRRAQRGLDGVSLRRHNRHTGGHGTPSRTTGRLRRRAHDASERVAARAKLDKARSQAFPRSRVGARRWANRLGPVAATAALAGLSAASMSRRRRRMLINAIQRGQAGAPRGNGTMGSTVDGLLVLPFVLSARLARPMWRWGARAYVSLGDWAEVKFWTAVLNLGHRLDAQWQAARAASQSQSAPPGAGSPAGRPHPARSTSPTAMPGPASSPLGPAPHIHAKPAPAPAGIAADPDNVDVEIDTDVPQPPRRSGQSKTATRSDVMSVPTTYPPHRVQVPMIETHRALHAAVPHSVVAMISHLGSLSAHFSGGLAGAVQGMGDRLMPPAYPIHPVINEYFREFADSWRRIGGATRQALQAYMDENREDIEAALNPQPNESWNDVRSTGGSIGQDTAPLIENFYEATIRCFAYEPEDPPDLLAFLNGMVPTMYEFATHLVADRIPYFPGAGAAMSEWWHHMRVTYGMTAPIGASVAGMYKASAYWKLKRHFEPRENEALANAGNSQ